MKIEIKITTGSFVHVVFDNHTIVYNDDKFFEIATPTQDITNPNFIFRAFRLLGEPLQSIHNKIGYYDEECYDSIFRKGML